MSLRRSLRFRMKRTSCRHAAKPPSCIHTFVPYIALLYPSLPFWLSGVALSLFQEVFLCVFLHTHCEAHLPVPSSPFYCRPTVVFCLFSETESIHGRSCPGTQQPIRGMQTSEHMATFNALTKTDAQAARVIDMRMRKLQRLQVRCPSSSLACVHLKDGRAVSERGSVPSCSSRVVPASHVIECNS